LLGVRKHTLQESVSLNLLDRVVDFQGGTIAYDLVYVLTLLATAVTIREKSQSVLPANEFASHRQNRTVRVYSTFLVQ